MRKVILVFPDVVSMTEFLLTYNVSKAITNTVEKEIRGMVRDTDLHIACKQYGAKIKKPVRSKSFG